MRPTAVGSTGYHARNTQGSANGCHEDARAEQEAKPEGATISNDGHVGGKRPAPIPAGMAPPAIMSSGAIATMSS